MSRLKRGVERNLSKEHRFICFADDVRCVPQGIEARPLRPITWLGCLPKLYVYSPDAGLEGRTLLLDLDNVITGSLDAMAEYDGDLAVRAWFGGYPHRKVADGDMVGFEAGSRIASRMWNDHKTNNTEEETAGRERYFLRQYSPDLWQDILGAKAILSYKRHLKGKREPGPETSIVSFHDGGKNGGYSRPHQIDEAWLNEVWQ